MYKFYVILKSASVLEGKWDGTQGEFVTHFINPIVDDVHTYQIWEAPAPLGNIESNFFEDEINDYAYEMEEDFFDGY